METKCINCGKEVNWELVEVCHECVEKKHGPFQKYTYHTNLNYVPKQTDGKIGE